MGANLRNTFANFIRFTAVVFLSTTDALHNEVGERKILNSEIGNTESSPSIRMSDAITTENSNAMNEALTSASADSRTDHLHNIVKLRHQTTDSLWESHKNSSESSIINKPVQLTNQSIKTNSWEFRSKRQTEGFGTQTGYKASVGYETSGVAGIDGNYLYSIRPKLLSSRNAGFGGEPSSGGGAEAEAGKKMLIPERAKRQSNDFGGAQTRFGGQTSFEVHGGAGAGGKQLQTVRVKRQSSGFGTQTGLGGNVGFGVGGGAGAGAGRKLLRTAREKRQTGFGAQTGFGVNAGFGIGGGVGGSSGNSEQTYRRGSGFGGQGSFGASVGFGVGGGTRAAG